MHKEKLINESLYKEINIYFSKHMNNLDFFLDNYNNKEINFDLKNQYKLFGYDDEDMFIIDLEFMLENFYDIKFIENKRKRLHQTEFRQELLKKFNNKCIITGESCVLELTACHIIPISEDENYDIENGLLLVENLHRTFDKYLWSINPKTKQIEVKININTGTINQYKDNNITIDLSPRMYINLLDHYNKFLSN